MQTLSGTKDRLAQHWIDLLMAKAKELRQTKPGISEIDIYPILKAWLSENCKGEPHSPLLTLEGKHGDLISYLL